MIKAIIFDFGGVIIKEAGKTIINIADAFNIDSDTVTSAVADLIKDYQKGIISTEVFWIKFSNKIGVDLPKNYNKLWTNSYGFKGRENILMIKTISNLRKSNYKIACLSNTIPPHVNYEKKHHNYDIFDIVVLSCEVKMRKPDKNIYEFTIKKLNVSPDECIFIDNIEEFLKPAERLGIKTIHFKSEKQCIKELASLGIKIP